MDKYVVATRFVERLVLGGREGNFCEVIHRRTGACKPGPGHVGHRGAIFVLDWLAGFHLRSLPPAKWTRRQDCKTCDWLLLASRLPFWQFSVSLITDTSRNLFYRPKRSRGDARIATAALFLHLAVTISGSVLFSTYFRPFAQSWQAVSLTCILGQVLFSICRYDHVPSGQYPPGPSGWEDSISVAGFTPSSLIARAREGYCLPIPLHCDDRHRRQPHSLAPSSSTRRTWPLY